MNEKRKALVGNDSDGMGILGLVLILIIVMIVIAVIVFGGVFIGGFHSIKNYVIAFKHNVVDGNNGMAAA